MPVVDLDLNVLMVDGGAVRLSPQEAELLSVLIEKTPRVARREFLYERLWGAMGGPNNIVQIDILVGRLRRKLQGTKLAIETERARGFRLLRTDDSLQRLKVLCGQ